MVGVLSRGHMGCKRVLGLLVGGTRGLLGPFTEADPWRGTVEISHRDEVRV